MPTFDKYAEYYDLLYKDKKYDQEADYIHELIQEYQPYAKSILELGSGTGKHAMLLSKKGYTVHGIDLSKNMVMKAIALSEKDKINGVQFTQGDIRTFRSNETFDVVISLFHVMSYQTKNEDILSAFLTASTHLNLGGLFIFDFWYGPAVLTERPEVRVKRMENKENNIIRIAEPKIYVNENIVDVKYEIIGNNKVTNEFWKIEELHHMRYFFIPEIEKYLEENNFSMQNTFIFLTKEMPNENSWNVCVLARKKA